VTIPRSLTVRRHQVGPWQMHSLVSTDTSPGDGYPLLFVHGLGMSSRYLTPTLDRLANAHRVHAPDLPGCGGSSRPDRPLDLRQMADAVVRWMDVADVGRSVVIGHSVGAQVAAHVAQRYPDRVDRLVLASPTGDPTSEAWHQAVKLLGGAVREAPRLIPLAVRDYVRAGPVRMWRTFGSTREPDPLEVFRVLQHRCLVVRGAHDKVVSARWGHAVADAARAGEVVTIPAAPHGLPFSAAPSLAATIHTFAVSAPTRTWRLPGNECCGAAPGPA
jgi:2-hydroxy-6-oxonona-2,4-dienedioate hydrolase